MTAAIEVFESFRAGLQAGQLPAIGSWGYLLLALLVMIEGPIATLLGAAAAGAGLMKPGWVFMAASAGNLTADSLWYGLGRAGRGEWIVRHGRWLGLRPRHMATLEQAMQSHAGKILLVAKLTAGFSIPALIAAGMARVPLRRWLVVLFIGECIWTGALVLAGVYLTESIVRVGQGLHYLATAGLISAALLATALIVRRLLSTEARLLAEREDAAAS
jgi:membrane protein DedA with SNARE-associated domain